MASAIKRNENGLSWSEAVVFNLFVKKNATGEDRALSLKAISAASDVVPQHASRAIVALKEKHGREVTKTADNRYWIAALHREGLVQETVPEKYDKVKGKATNGKKDTTTNGRRKRQARADTHPPLRVPKPDELPAMKEHGRGDPIPDDGVDPESEALAVCAVALAPLEEIAQHRVLDYLAHRFVVETEAG